jgi:hypothetical protein
VPEEFLAHLREQRRHAKAIHEENTSFDYMDDNEITGINNKKMYVDADLVMDEKLINVHKPHETISDYQFQFKEENNLTPPFQTVINEKCYTTDFSDNFIRENINVDKAVIGSSSQIIAEIMI